MNEIAFIRMNPTKQSFNRLNTICSLQTVIWLAIALMIMHFLILPSAMSEVHLLTNNSPQIQDVIFQESAKMSQILKAYGEKGRSLYVTIELSAGLLTSLFSFCFGLVLVTFVLFKNQSLWSRRKRLYLFPIIGLLAAILEIIGIVDLFSSYPSPSGTSQAFVMVNYVIRVFCFGVSIIAPLIILIYDSFFSSIEGAS